MATELKQDTVAGLSNDRKLMVLSALLGRAQLAARLGLQYDNARDVYQALGYKHRLEYTV